MFESELNELDPYNEENWDGIEEITPATQIKIGDIIYWDDDIELCIVTKIEKRNDGDYWIYGIISQESIDRGYAYPPAIELPFGKKSLINNRLKIKQV